MCTHLHIRIFLGTSKGREDSSGWSQIELGSCYFSVQYISWSAATPNQTMYSATVKPHLVVTQ